jgi:hypothetical protein
MMPSAMMERAELPVHTKRTLYVRSAMMATQQHLGAGFTFTATGRPLGAGAAQQADAARTSLRGVSLNMY